MYSLIYENPNNNVNLYNNTNSSYWVVEFELGWPFTWFSLFLFSTVVTRCPHRLSGFLQVNIDHVRFDKRYFFSGHCLFWFVCLFFSKLTTLTYYIIYSIISYMHNYWKCKTTRSAITLSAQYHIEYGCVKDIVRDEASLIDVFQMWCRDTNFPQFEQLWHNKKNPKAFISNVITTMFPIEMTTVWFLMFDAVCFYFGMVDFLVVFDHYWGSNWGNSSCSHLLKI